ncbi:FecR family protein [Leeuwenhoekiella polynyae]|uniref:FecR family protein n=1 Tax=Leeuwenhoekiella polynyae TaxID=1550906 RepID=A0A4Q0P720_9FLAO|nr:FecR family protein [Leeuwenhoekiella polynyae]RXG22235.1 FecR family protein [Leeuwenhoekiella polynyae]
MKSEIILINKLLKGTISSKEKLELKKWVLEDPDHLEVFKKKIQKYNPDSSIDFNAEKAYQKFISATKAKKQTPKLTYRLLKYAAVFALLFTIGYQVKEYTSEKLVNENVTLHENTLDPKDEIIITLADGTQKVISTKNDNQIKDKEGNIVAKNDHNSLSFLANESSSSEKLVYNEIYIPFGEKFKIILSDGTTVHLNSGSKLRFPQRFVSSLAERKVFLEGEGFFEVTKNAKKPFIVNAKDIDVKVLGTKFNVSSYDTNESVTATLVEGAVSVYRNSTPEEELRLTPSYQASYNKKDGKLDKAVVDTDIYTAWMQGKLIINNLKFSEILIKLERMYDVKFINKAKNLDNEIFKGEFNNEDLETILKTIELSTPFNYEKNNNVITISN